ncbi:hypothetical protein LZ016_07660 [Sphingomonas sp. SM33]|uniref:Cell envelope biogenesis protein TolA n=1 Tax=Sphingomonas telluris TaxID=2907998 RepID=A0ABS9VLY3_9SPHN|nr:hypothetical protein [Sphingomonas telluris]MCH8615974.1 hypothetical protein [Sphingomonas telluris]
MAKTPKTSARKQKLKVFRTPIGFHDAYVAAPSQKAALEAWGAEANLFAQNIAEQVTDPELMEEPLANPGQVIRRLRGSEEEHVAALGKQKLPKRVEKAEPIKPASRGPKPSRDELDAAEAALEKAEKKQRKELREFDEKLEALQRKRRDLQRKHEAKRDALAEARDEAKAAYERAVRRWER